MPRSEDSGRSRSGRSSYSEEDEGDSARDRKAACIRNVANFSKIKPFQLLDKHNFNPALLEHYLEQSSPKLVALFEKIAALDAKDERTTGQTFKHIIYTDNKSSTYGAKILASAFIAKGFHPCFHRQGTGFAIHPEDRLMQTKGRNFSLLMSKTVYDRSMNVKFKKSIMELFNRRPDNIHGDLTRFIILDQGFKEGIDLFDVKYVHLFEPLVVRADEKQAIGRGTRFCGQRGLEFHPRFGWPLYVFRYEVTLPDDDELRRKYHGSKQLFELYLKFADIDLRKVVFAAELEQAAIDASVDKELTRAIHQFSIERPPPILAETESQSGGVVLRSSVPKPPTKLFNSVAAMQQHIQKGFKVFTYPKVILENQCKEMSGGAPQLVKFTPTQDFIRHYFQPSSAYKGMLLWHSVGTGKTCSAIATASTSFEREGYTILWVTRHTLKSDIWKNMFQWVCSMTVQERLGDGTLKLPAKLGNPKRFAPPEWMEPISYKQFSNMLLKKNSVYNEIVKRNGANDPLRKTLVIIDEAHKLYSPTVVGSEKPNTDILEEMVHHSYAVSGKDSVRLLVMTATPYTEDSMEMMKLLNLLRPDSDALPTDFEDFQRVYLTDEGKFKPKGLKAFQDRISGYVSYLNRSQDARNFAHPVLENVFVPLTQEPPTIEQIPVLDKEGNPVLDEDGEPKMKNPPIVGKYDAQLAEMKDQEKAYKTAKKAYTDCTKQNKPKAKAAVAILKQEQKTALEACKEKPMKERKQCRADIQAAFKQKIKVAMESTTDESCEELLEILKTHEATMEDSKTTREELKDFLKDISETMKALRDENKELAKEYKELKPKVKPKQFRLKQKRKDIMAIRDPEQRKARMKIFKETDVKEVKAFIDQFKRIQARISGIREDRQLLKLQLGKVFLRRISQELALEKRCKAHELY
jgi:hypothetical protein